MLDSLAEKPLETDSAVRALPRPFIGRNWLIAALLALAAVPRIDVAFRIPVGQPQWFWRADLFWSRLESGDLGGTFLAPHPGLTVLWIAGAAERLSNAVTPREQALAASLATLVADLMLLALLLGLVWRLMEYLGAEARVTTTALVGLLLAFDPQLIPMTGLVGLDGMFSLSMCCALLALARRPALGDKGWTVAPSLLSAFAVATKGVGLALLLAPAIREVAAGEARPRRWRSACVTIASIAGASVLFVVLLLPAVWVDPGRVIDRLLFGLGGTRESLVGVFRLERAEELRGYEGAPGAVAYLTHWLFRSTPVALLGLVAGATCRTFRRDPIVRFLAAFALVFLVLLAVAAQKEWRYLVPHFVLLDILAGVGFAHFLRRSAKARHSRLAIVLVAAVFAVQSAWVVSASPHYEFRLNPLFGGLQAGHRLLAVGWGSGLERAHAALARQANEQRRVIGWTGGYGNSGERDRKGLEFEAANTRWLGPRADPSEADCHVFYVRNQTPARREAESYWNAHGSLVYELVFDGVSITSVWCRNDERGPARSAGRQDATPSPMIARSE